MKSHEKQMDSSNKDADNSVDGKNVKETKGENSQKDKAEKTISTDGIKKSMTDLLDKAKKAVKDLRNTKFVIKINKKEAGKSGGSRDRSFALSLLYPVVLMLYLELTFHLLIFKAIDGKIIYPIIFAVPVGLLFTLLSGFFDKKINKLILWILTSITCLIFCIQLIYYYIFKVFFTFQSMGMAGDAITEFGSDITTAVLANIFWLVVLVLPLPALALLLHKYDFPERRKLKDQGTILAGVLVIQLIAMAALLIFGKGDYTPYDLYYNTKVPDLCGRQLGLVTLTRFDLAKLIKGGDKLVLADTKAVSWEAAEETKPTPKPVPKPKKEAVPAVKLPDATPTPTLPPTPTPIDESPNVMDIDFNSLAKNEKKDTIKTLHEYFASVTPTNRNEYTGMFKGYNLIMVTAEGFSPYAVNKQVTPTLYKLTHEGFVFNNFYTALWQTSTSDGEYVAMTSLIPVGSRSMYKTRNNLMPFSLGHQFNLLGIDSKAYHDHTYTYYQRNETYPNMGYNYKGVGNGLVLDHNVWPNSDLEMINHTVDEYVNEDQFHVYYLTVSGHMNYTFIGNSMSYKNRELVKDLPYSSDVKAYIACQIELDRALAELIKRLEAAGVADKTVIALSADHYPYGWEKEKYDEIAGHTVDPVFEIYRNNFILWNPGMKQTIIVDKPASSLDILPTLCNLFDIKYDSRLLMGQDVFSDAEPLVILNNRSFITDKVMYNSETGEVTYLTDEHPTKDYINNLNKVIKNKFNVSQSIVKNDYYRYVFPEYPDDFK